MSTIPTSAEVQFREDGTVTVRPSIRLDHRSQVYCFIYDTGPVLVVTAGNVRLSLSVPDHDRVTDEDVEKGRELAEAVTRYVSELEQRAAASEDASGKDRVA